MTCGNENRIRSKTIAFRVTPDEYEMIISLAKLSGMTRQDYMAHRALQRDVVIVPSSRTVRALKEHAVSIIERLETLVISGCPDAALARDIKWMIELLDGFASYGDSEFDATARIVNLSRE